MDIEGTFTLQASPEAVWTCLMDQQTLRAAPDIERLEALGENRYAATMYIKQAPLGGTYQGEISISDQHYPYNYRISVQGEGRLGPVGGEGIIALRDHDENTVVVYRGTLNLGKMATLLPPPIVKGAAKLLIQQFFLALAEQLRMTQSPSSVVVDEFEDIAVLEASGARVGGTATATEPTFARTLVRRLRLGADDPTAEALWVRRLRRFGIAMALLLLVWVGTRIPRR